MKYHNKLHKSLATKEGAQNEGLSIQEVEHHLDADLFLDEYSHWKAGGPHHLFILQRIFLQAAESVQREMGRPICWGHHQGLQGLDTRVDVPAVQLVGYKTSWEEIWELYTKVYLLRRLPGPSPCGPQWAQELTQDILSSMEDCLQWRRGDDAPEVGQEWGAASTLLPHHLKENHETMTHIAVNSLRPGRSIGGHWQLPTCWRRGSKAWVDQLQKWGRVTAGVSLARTIMEEI